MIFDIIFSLEVANLYKGEKALVCTRSAVNYYAYTLLNCTYVAAQVNNV